jgi:hypothetical protein
MKSKLFDIGIDSVVLIGIITKLNKEFEVNLRIERVFSAKNIKDICKLILKNEKVQRTVIEKSGIKDYYSTSRMQQNLYLACISNPQRNRAYRIRHAIITEGDFNIDLCKSIINTLVRRHEALRTSISEINGEIIQQIHDIKEFPVHVLQYEETDIYKTIFDRLMEDRFDGTNLFKFFIINFSDNKNMLVFDVHHIIADGLSLHILMDEFVKLYNRQVLKDNSIQYKDYVEWNNTLMNSDEKQYWKEMLSGDLPVMKLPYDYMIENQSTYDGDSVSFRIDGELFEHLKESSKVNGYTKFIYMYAAAYAMLADYYDSDDIIIGTTSSGRTFTEIENVVGMFVNTLPVRVKVNKEDTVEELMGQVREKIVSGMEKQKFIMEDIINDINLKGNMLYDIIFSYQYYDTSMFEVEGVTFKPFEIPHHECKLPMEISILEMNDCINVKLIYSTELFSKSSVISLAESYKEMITAITDDISLNLDNIMEKDIDTVEVDENLFDFSF